MNASVGERELGSRTNIERVRTIEKMENILHKANKINCPQKKRGSIVVGHENGFALHSQDFKICQCTPTLFGFTPVNFDGIQGDLLELLCVISIHGMNAYRLRQTATAISTAIRKSSFFF